MERHMGEYEVVTHRETPECSLRLLRLGKAKAVLSHYHKNTTQIYFGIEGTAEVTLGNNLITLHPFEIVRVPPHATHHIRSSTSALILSISIPPLEIGDQHPVG